MGNFLNSLYEYCVGLSFPCVLLLTQGVGEGVWCCRGPGVTLPSSLAWTLCHLATEDWAALPSLEPTGSGQRESKGLERAQGMCVPGTKTKDGGGAFEEVVEGVGWMDQDGAGLSGTWPDPVVLCSNFLLCVPHFQ